MMVGTEGFKLLGSHFTPQTKLFRSDAHPFPSDSFALGIVVVSPEMILQVGVPVINFGSGEHGFFLTRYDRMYSM
jgi:hypothetical protein